MVALFVASNSSFNVFIIFPDIWDSNLNPAINPAVKWSKTYNEIIINLALKVVCQLVSCICENTKSTNKSIDFQIAVPKTGVVIINFCKVEYKGQIKPVHNTTVNSCLIKVKTKYPKNPSIKTVAYAITSVCGLTVSLTRMTIKVAFKIANLSF